MDSIHSGRVPTATRPTLFIGSTVEALQVAQTIQAELDHDLDATVWNQGLFSPGVTTWAQLTADSRGYDFALFIFSGDDEVKSRGEHSIAVRDNLLIEYGLLAGLIGSERTLFLYNRDHRPKIASDLGGVTPLTYRDRNDNNLRAAISPACVEIRRIVGRLGKVAPSVVANTVRRDQARDPISPSVNTHHSEPANDPFRELVEWPPEVAVNAAWSALMRSLEAATRRAEVPIVGNSHSALALADALAARGVLSPATLQSVTGLTHLRKLLETAPKDQRMSESRTREFLAMAGAASFSVELDVERFLREEHR